MTTDDDWLLAELRRIGRTMRRPKATSRPEAEEPPAAERPGEADRPTSTRHGR
jgi:hypothetical protein